tara:strand:- start:8546 stop:9388 length:843 start_codon:yes stop_codon:yes gene_type:complete
MAINKYFNNFSYAGEQDLVEDLTIEAIKIYGHDVRYMPRTLVKEDNLFGEDTLSQFNLAVPVEMYIKNVEGFEGEGDFLSRFNLEIRDQLTLTVARKRFDQISQGESLQDEVGYTYQLETANTSAPANSHMLMLEAGSAGVNSYSISSSRPLEGDLIYFPLNDKIFEIKFVEHEEVFYQTGRLQTYDLRCELFQYSHEQLDTGNTEIDAIETRYSGDMLFYEMLLESGDKLVSEDGDSIVQESFRIETTDASANNEFYGLEADSILDFSEGNPFSEVDRY